MEEGAPGFLDNHYNIRQMIHNGDFKDGTYINKPVHGADSGDHVFHSPRRGCPAQCGSEPLHFPTQPGCCWTFTMDRIINHMFHQDMDAQLNHNVVSTSLPTAGPDTFTMGGCARTQTVISTTPFVSEKEMFEIIPPGQETMQVVCVACPRPPQLKVLLSELQVNALLSEADCRLEYEKRPGEIMKVNSQKQLEAYLALPNRPKLFVARTKRTT